jgi:flavodoxin
LIAEAIPEKLNGAGVHVDQSAGYDMNDYDLIVIGSPVHGGMPTGKIEMFLSEIPKPKMSAVFVTFGAPLFGPMTANACLNKMEKKLQGTCLGRFKCHGYHKIFFTYPSHPDEQDKADATQFAEKLLEKCLNHNNENP